MTFDAIRDNSLLRSAKESVQAVGLADGEVVVGAFVTGEVVGVSVVMGLLVDGFLVVVTGFFVATGV